MRKKISIFLAAVLVLMTAVIPKMPVYAAALTIGVSSSAGVGDPVSATISVPNGGSAMVTVKYDTSVLTFTGSSVTSSGGDGAKQLSIYNASGTNGTTSATISFKAVGAGTASILVVATDSTDIEGTDTSFESASAKVSVNNDSGNSGSPSGNNNSGNSDSSNTDSNNGDNSLSALTISAGTLSPAFSYKTTSYSTTVDYSVTNLAVSATPSNASATIASVTGNENLQVGDNTVTIVVKAGNGVTANYTINVKRRAEDDPENQKDENSSENSDNPEAPAAEHTGVGDGKFEVEGQAYVPSETIPEEMIPTDFTASTISFGENTYACLNFAKGDLTLLYLVPEESADGAGVLYVYDAQSNSIYQFVRLATESHYVIVLLPNVEEIPSGYTESFLSIEGKGQVAAYQKDDSQNLNTDTKQPDSQNSDSEKDNSLGFVDAIGECVTSVFRPETVQAAEAAESDFYLMYCMNDNGEKGWYQYDSVEGTYQRCSDQLSGGDLTDKYKDAMDQIKNLTKRSQFMILGMIIGSVIFIIIIIVLIVKRKNKDDISDDEFEDDDSEMESLEQDFALNAEDDTEDNLEEDEDDEIEVEFYEMDKDAEEATESDVNEDVDTEETEELEEVEESDDTMEEDDDEIEVEFFEMESDSEPAKTETLTIPSREHKDEQFEKAAEEIQSKYGEENIRVTKRSMMDKFMDKMSLTEEDDEDFESNADLNGDGEADGEELLAASIAQIKAKQQERHTERLVKLQEELEQATERENVKKVKEAKKTKTVVDEDDDDLEFLDLN